MSFLLWSELGPLSDSLLFSIKLWLFNSSISVFNLPNKLIRLKYQKKRNHKQCKTCFYLLAGTLEFTRVRVVAGSTVEKLSIMWIFSRWNMEHVEFGQIEIEIEIKIIFLPCFQPKLNGMWLTSCFALRSLLSLMVVNAESPSLLLSLPFVASW